MSQTLETKTHYRADIQGLRGIAVLLVVVYHTGLALPGGFVGVDMFFVISGFVITQVLIREYEETGRIKLGQFYARRARRLIPALSIVTIFTLLISLVAMSPFGEQQQIIKTAIASTFFAGNIHLFAMNSYEALKDNPLRHLWSLGVEEQFYWIYPALVVGVIRATRRRFYSTLTILLLVIAAASFVIGVLLTFGFEFGYTSGSSLSSQFSFLAKIGFEPGGDWPTKFAFFGAPARFWEILVGSLAALAIKTLKYKSKSEVIASLLTATAIAALVWSTVILNSHSAFPGALALLPVFGTVVLILFNQHVRPINRILIFSPLIYLGDISYSLYLWHWPLIVFSRAMWPGTSYAPLIAVVISLFVAVASNRLIEQKFNKSVRIEKSKVTATVIAVSLPLMTLLSAVFVLQIANTGLGITGIENKSDDFASRLNNNCGSYQKEFVTKCKVGPIESKFTAYLFGDSHAQAASTGVAEAVSQLGGTLIVAAGGGCPFLLIDTNQFCGSFNDVRFAKTKLLRPDVVIIVNHQTTWLVDRLNGGGVSWATKTNQIEGLSKTLDWLDSQGIPAVVQGEIPICDFKVNLISKYSSKRQFCWQNYDEQRLHLEFLNATQKLVSNYERHVFFDPRNTICPNAICAPYVNNKMIFVDVSHLSPTGSKMLAPVYLEAIRKVLEQP
jgi:peptidoglycan/LPS O-acetylase OafA/YrhL